MHENEISAAILDAAIKVHRGLGPGLLETVYETALAHELQLRGFTVERQRAIPFIYEGVRMQQGFRADLIVNGKVLIEIKSVEIVPPVAYKVVLTYLRLADLKLGLLINFHEDTVRDGFRRVVNNL